MASEKTNTSSSPRIRDPYSARSAEACAGAGTLVMAGVLCI